MVIRRASVADAEAIATIQVHGHRWAYAGILPQPLSDAEWIAQRSEVWTRLLAAEEPSRAYVGERDGRVVAFVTVGASDDATTGMLYALYLEPDVIGSGVGRALLETAVAAMREVGFREAVLWVLEENARARKFYEAGGWVCDGTRKDYERDGAARHELRYRRAL